MTRLSNQHIIKSPNLHLTHTLLMLRPAHFGYNAETALNNAFQQAHSASAAQAIQAKALTEFDQMVESLRAKGIQVLVFEDTSLPAKPDAIFPNNWLSTHGDKLLSYPMQAASRRPERRMDIIEALQQQFGYEHVSLAEFEARERFLEGTGSLVLDRERKIAYACWSPRTHAEVLKAFCSELGYQAITFEAKDAADTPIYHTNVLMAQTLDYAVICLEAISNQQERQQVVEALAPRPIIEISLEQMQAFAGNMIQVQNQQGEQFLLLSETAFQALTPTQIQQLEQHNSLLPIAIPTIEKHGGGSVRCMVAEVF